MERREVASRGNKWIQGLSGRLVRSAVTPNQISSASIAFAALVPVGLFVVQGAWGALLAIVGIQARLLCNVVDGLVAVEGGKQSALGALYNELPDRVADSIVLVALGYALGLPAAGWLAALLAALTAYVRVFGGALGQPQRFLGPMAKQHRMATATAALVLMIAAALGWWSEQAAWLARGLLWVVVVGSAITCWRRTHAIARDLKT